MSAAVLGDLGDAVVAVLRLVRALPGERDDARPRASRRIEHPAPVRAHGAAEDAPRLRGDSGETRVLGAAPESRIPDARRASVAPAPRRMRPTGSASYDGSSAGASFACAWRSSCACVSF